MTTVLYALVITCFSYWNSLTASLSGFCTPLSLTKNLLIYLLLHYTWRIPSHFLLLSLPPCLLTLQRFFFAPVPSLASWVPSDIILPQYLLSSPSLCFIACLYFGNWVSWSNASFTGRTHAQIPWLLKVTWEVHGRLGKKPLSLFEWHPVIQLRSSPLHLDLLPWWFFISAGSIFPWRQLPCVFSWSHSELDSEFFGNDFNVFCTCKASSKCFCTCKAVHLYSAT